MINRDEFVLWKADPVTVSFMESLNQKREDIKEVLVLSAGEDPIKDSVLRGYCTCITDVLDVTVQDLESE